MRNYIEEEEYDREHSEEPERWDLGRIFALVVVGLFVLLFIFFLIPDSTLTVTVDLSEIEADRVILYEKAEDLPIPKDSYDIFTGRSYELLALDLRGWRGSKLYFMGRQGNQWYATEKNIEGLGWMLMVVNSRRMELNYENPKLT